MITPEGNDPRTFRWRCNIRPGERISAEEQMKTKIELHAKMLTVWILQWFDHLFRKIEEGAWSSKCRIFKVGGSLSRRLPRKTLSKVIRKNLKERKVSMDLAKENPCQPYTQGKYKIKWIWWWMQNYVDFPGSVLMGVSSKISDIMLFSLVMLWNIVYSRNIVVSLC